MTLPEVDFENSDLLVDRDLLVVGLGNPGKGYCFHRHNAGFMVVDRLAATLRVTFEPCGKLGAIGRIEERSRRGFLLKPLTYMNRSGRAVGEVRDHYDIPLARVLVVSDDFNLPLGRIRIRRKGSDGGHNGLSSIIRTLGTEEFSRLRVGVGPLPSGKDPADFVLSDFCRKERVPLQEVLVLASEALRLWIEGDDLELLMSRYNQNSLPEKEIGD